MWGKLRKYAGDGLVAAGLAMMCVGIAFGSGGQKGVTAKVVKAKVTPTIDVQVNSKVRIDVAGEVIKPGVYSLKNEDRVQEALAAAGGLSGEADREWVAENINLAKRLVDGEKIFIPKKGSEPPSSFDKLRTTASQSNIQGISIININTAGMEELDKLTGVGPATAQKIIDYREMNGGFKSIEEIKSVAGIGEALYEKIKDKISI